MTSNFFIPVVEREKQHINFLQMLEDHQAALRDTFNNWAEGFIDRDGKLIKEFQTSFNSTFWEVYLHALLKDGGLKVDYNYASPDFVIKYDDIEFCMEAVISNAARGELPEWHKETFKPDWKPASKSDEDYAHLNRNAMIRHSNAILSKFKKYQTKYSQLEHVKDRPFVIALGAFDSPNSWEEIDRAIMAVLFDFYIDEQDAFAGEVLHHSPFPVKTLGSIKKPNGADICLGLFNSPQMEDVSAIAYSCTATFGKLRALSPQGEGVNIFSYHWLTPEGPVAFNSPIGQERLGDGLMIFHNPFAKYPLPEEPFQISGVAHYYFDIDGINDYQIVSDGGPLLLTRANLRINFVDR